MVIGFFVVVVTLFALAFILTLCVEALGTLVISIAIIVKLIRSSRRGIKLKQFNLLRYGMWTWVIGVILVASPPFLMRVPEMLINNSWAPLAATYNLNSFSNFDLWIWLIISTAGFFAVIMGYRFLAAAYKNVNNSEIAKQVI